MNCENGAVKEHISKERPKKDVKKDESEDYKSGSIILSRLIKLCIPKEKEIREEQGRKKKMRRRGGGWVSKEKSSGWEVDDAEFQ